MTKRTREIDRRGPPVDRHRWWAGRAGASGARGAARVIGWALPLALLSGCLFEDLELELIPVPDAEVPDQEIDAPICLEGETEGCYVDALCVGQRTCIGDVWGPCEPMAEVCDAADNDCDGAADEDFEGVGDPCEDGLGACRVTGHLACTADKGGVACDVTAGDGGAEACNGIDDDCDGAVDEEAPTGADCDTGVPGVCSAGLTACVAGATVCVQQAEPIDESCDSQDNDCDGAVDEDELGGGALAIPCYEGPPETRGVGGCTDGARVCVDGALTGCMGQILPAVEICDLIDNDCDGEFGDIAGGAICGCSPGQRRACYSGPGETADVGECRVGSQVCLGDGLTYGPCEGEVLPDLELCDGLDNDCDGVVDDAAGAGEPCTVGVGACAAEGERICDPITGFVVCLAEAAPPAEEVCNGIDDDCNGRVDDLEGVGEACVSGQGACRSAGDRICDPVRGEVICRAPPRNPGDEVCNGIDDDCDGIVDDVEGRGEACAVGEGVCASAGQQVCDYATAELACGAQPNPAQAEACNGLDDDCDAAVDEGGVCGELECGDDLDDDGDGAMDCDDPDCAFDFVTCTCAEDVYGAGSTVHEPIRLGAGIHEGLAVCTGEGDWFVIEWCGNGQLTVRADGVGAEGEGNGVEMVAYEDDTQVELRRPQIDDDPPRFGDPIIPNPIVRAVDEDGSRVAVYARDPFGGAQTRYARVHVTWRLGDRPRYALQAQVDFCGLESCANEIDDDGDGDTDCDDAECENQPVCNQ